MESWLLLAQDRWGSPTGQILASITGALGGGVIHLAYLQHPHRSSTAHGSSGQGILSLVASELVFAPDAVPVSLVGTHGFTGHGRPSPAALLLEMLYASVMPCPWVPDRCKAQ